MDKQQTPEQSTFVKETLLCLSAKQGVGQEGTNAIWTNTLKKSITLSEGDQLSVYRAFIDSRLSSQSAINIEIEENIPVTLQFYYYKTHNDEGNTFSQTMANEQEPFPQPEGSVYESFQTLVIDEFFEQDFTNNFPGPIPWIYTIAGQTNPDWPPSTAVNNATGEPLLLYRWDSTNTRLVPYVKQVTFTVPKGIYNPTVLAELITKNVNLQINQFQQRALYTLEEDPTNASIMQSPQQLLNRNTLPTLADIAVNDRSHYEQTEAPFDSTDNVGPLYPILSNFNWTNQIQVPEQEVPISNVVFATLIDDTTFQNTNLYAKPCMQFCRRATSADEAPFGQNWLYDIQAVGPTSFALTYNANNDSKFRFEFMHQPIIVDGDPGAMHKRSYAAIADGDGMCTALLNQSSGVLLADLQPRSFWQSLGFNVSNIVTDVERMSETPFPSGRRQFTYEEFLRKSTRAYCGTDMTFTITSQVQPQKEQLFINDTTYFQSFGATQEDIIPFSTVQTIALSAPTPPLNPADSGHILVEIINSGIHTEYIDENTTAEVKAIIPTYYNSDGFISSQNVDSFNATIIGQPVTLSSFTVRLISPSTGLPITCGPNSVIYLQVLRQINSALAQFKV